MNEQQLIEKESQIIERIEELEQQLKPLDDKCLLGIMEFEECEKYITLYNKWQRARKELHTVTDQLNDLIYEVVK